MKPIAVIADWYGPYDSVKQAARAARDDYSAGLYIVIGKLKHQKSSPKIQYIGVASELARRLYSSRGIKQVVRERYLWLGEIVSVRIPGKKTKVIDRQLDLTEWAHAFFLQPPLNDKKTMAPPDRPVTVINRWWQKDYCTQFQKRPHRDWPDVIDFRGHEHGARIAWFGSSRLERWSAEELI